MSRRKLSAAEIARRAAQAGRSPPPSEPPPASATSPQPRRRVVTFPGGLGMLILAVCSTPAREER